MLAAILAFQAAQPIDVTAEVIYQVNLRAIGPTHDFKALKARLPAIKSLGATTLWLMPIHPVGKLRSVGDLGSPYAVRDYRAVNPEFGTLQDFGELLKSAREHKLKVIIDWVANHTAWDHDWIRSRPDWYVKDAKGNIIIPPGTNWQDVAELNFEKPELRRAMQDAMADWVRFGVDGFRCDYADGVPTDFWKSSLASVRKTTQKPLMMLAEGAGAGLPASGFDLFYDWESFAALQRVAKGATTAPEALRIIRRGQNPGLRFITNHDEFAWNGTPIEMFGSDEAAMASFAALALSPGGTPLVYCGQEAPSTARIPFFTRSTIAFDQGAPQQAQIRQILTARRVLPQRGTVTDLSQGRLLHLRVAEGAANWQVAVNLCPEPIAVPGGPVLAPWKWLVRKL